MDAKKKAAAIAGAVETAGPLHARAVVPSYAEINFTLHRYSPWFVAHIDQEKLADDVLKRHYAEWLANDVFAPHDELEDFFQYLERLDDDYIVLHSTYEDGFCVLPVE
jgi:hypothetical protein